jgi:hypothetical protein
VRGLRTALPAQSLQRQPSLALRSLGLANLEPRGIEAAAGLSQLLGDLLYGCAALLLGCDRRIDGLVRVGQRFLCLGYGLPLLVRLRPGPGAAADGWLAAGRRRDALGPGWLGPGWLGPGWLGPGRRPAALAPAGRHVPDLPAPRTAPRCPQAR